MMSGKASWKRCHFKDVEEKVTRQRREGNSGQWECYLQKWEKARCVQGLRSAPEGLESGSREQQMVTREVGRV